MHILFVLQYYFPYVGGLESLFQNLAEGLVRRGHFVKVVTTRLHQTLQTETVNGVEIERVKVPPYADRHFFTLFGILPSSRTARWSDIIHTAPYNGAVPAFLAARKASRPIVFTALEVLGSRWHQVEPNFMKAIAYRAFEKITVNLPYDRFVSISKATLNDCITHGMDAEKGCVIYPGVDAIFTPGQRSNSLRNRYKIPKDAFLYLYFGRPGITKGVDDLLEAAPEIQQHIPSAKLVLILANQPRRQYIDRCRLAEKLREKADILILPTKPRQQLADVLREADCIVIPSRTEGFGLTAAEACALNIPVVATDAGSLPEVISGRHVLVPIGSPHAIAQGVIRIWRKKWNEIPARRFSWDQMVDSYLSLYKEMLVK